MVKKTKIEELVGADLAGFKIVEMIEVYAENKDDGDRFSSLAFFTDEDAADLLLEDQSDTIWLTHKKGRALVLTDGVSSYAIDYQEPIKVLDKKDVVLKIKERAVTKLTSTERKAMKCEE